LKYFFDKIIKPYIIQNKYKNLCEIGSGKGDHADKLLLIGPVSLSIVDPCLDSDLLNKYRDFKRVKVLKGLSLEILPKISERFDCILIDGDHNWFTVFNELKIIEERNLIKNGGTIFFHDVCWPYGRRDMYYLPGSIPEAFRHPYAKKGIERDKSALSETSTFINHRNNAIYEGGPRNGVLTAIEDFLDAYGKQYKFFYFKRKTGLGVLIKGKNVKTKIIFLRWLYLIKYYEIIDMVPRFLKYLSRPSGAK
jgi:hypothetical protein